MGKGGEGNSDPTANMEIMLIRSYNPSAVNNFVKRVVDGRMFDDTTW